MNIATPLDKQNLALLQSMDYRTYAYAYDPGDYQQMAKKGTMLSCLAMVDSKPVGFSIWERGPRGKPAYIVRFGVLPNMRRKKIGTQMLSWVMVDLKNHGKRTVKTALSHVTCLGPGDPDDVSGFMIRVGFKWTSTIEKVFFEYGCWEDGIVFERSL